MLPLDLHVLGLPLAFILSQDQTLRCKNFEFFVVLSQGITFFYAVFPFFLNLSKNLFVICRFIVATWHAMFLQ